MDKGNNSEFFLRGKAEGCNKLIVTFGGMAAKSGGIPPFEFLRFLRQVSPEIDCYFYADLHQLWYHKGFQGITNNIEETVEYLRGKIERYDSVLFMGISSGGYSALLFGSILNVKSVIAFVPQTILGDEKQKQVNPNYDYNALNENYLDLKKHINKTTQYLLYGSCHGPYTGDFHQVAHIENIESLNFKNIKTVKVRSVYMKRLRDSGELANILKERFLEL